MTPPRPELSTLRVPSPAAAWEALGFTLTEGAIHLGGVRIVPGDEWGWSFGGPPAEEVTHVNGATAVDHVVMLTDDFDTTLERLRGEGFDHRRTRDAGDGRRQAFFVLGPCLLELAGPSDITSQPLRGEGITGPVDGGERLWGITLVAPDLEPFGGRIKEAVQPGRLIATIPKEAGLKIPVAVMTPR